MIEHFDHDHELVYVYTVDLDTPIFQTGPEVIDMFYLDLKSFMSDQATYILTNACQQQHLISSSQICPHDVSLIRQYISNQMKS